MPDRTTTLSQWVDAVARQAQPERIQWCDGSDAEWETLRQEMLDQGEILPLNPKTHPNCYLHRSDPTDVARVEHVTYICTPQKDDAGPNNNWMSLEDAHRLYDGLFEGAMRNRTLYVVPYCMGPVDSPWSQIGVEITDSRYVVANMRLMTRMGPAVLKRIEAGESFVRGQHSLGDLSPDRRYILHYPTENLIQSIGSGYGGNALLGKKCHALRIASWNARREGWLAEHMLIVGIENPQGEVFYMAAAFPSSCGKTNLAMLIPPASYRGWKVWTVGDDIAWMHVGPDGRLWAINPEAGYFGVVPGTNATTNPNAFRMTQRDTLFTNVAVTKDNDPWWEGLSTGEPAFDWRGRPYDPANGPAAHPNSRFTIRAERNPAWSPHSLDPLGVPITAILFGGRRAHLTPLVYETKNWAHGVLSGCALASETTAAASGKTGVIRRDPMAMLPFCGYHFGDYWNHWIQVGEQASQRPRIFHVNWFRQGPNGNYLWPGFGDNMRVIQWVLDRCADRASARETAIGYLPTPGDGFNLEGLSLDAATLRELLAVDRKAWVDEFDQIESFMMKYEPRVPVELKEALQRVQRELSQEPGADLPRPPVERPADPAGP